MTAAQSTAKTKWKGRRRHEVTLPSGAQVKIEVPNLPELLRAGEVPNNLVKLVHQAEQQLADPTEEVTADKIRETTDFMRWLVVTTVKEPALVEDDVPELPAEDVDQILEFALRNRDHDAAGHHLGGLEKSASFRSFRYGRSGDSAGAGL